MIPPGRRWDLAALAQGRGGEVPGLDRPGAQRATPVTPRYTTGVVDVEGAKRPLALKMPSSADDAYQVFVNGNMERGIRQVHRS